MQKYRILFAACLLIFIGAVSVPFAFAQSPDQKVGSLEFQKQLQDVLKQLQILQQQVAELRAELGKQPEGGTVVQSEAAPPELTRTLSRGSSGDDVRKLQEFLAKDKDVYPEGLHTGFYGPLTEAAVKRWQEKHGVTALGIVGPKTIIKFQELGRGAVQALTTEGAGGSENIPPGLLTAPGIQKKLEISSTATSSTATTTTTSPTVTATTTLVATTTPIAIATTSSGTIPATPTTTPVPSSGAGSVSVAVPVTPPGTPTPATPATPTAATTTTATTTPNTTPPSPLPQAPPITVTSPNGGSVWDIYHYNQGITYTLNGVSRVGFKLLKSSHVVYSNSAPITTNSTTLSLPPTWDWLPSTQYNSVGSGSDYKIRVFDWDHPEVYDDSDNYFSIPTPDITPPVVSSVLASSITSNSAVIAWTTDEPATGFVNYGSTSNDWKVTPEDTSLVTSHSFTLSNLASNVPYSFRVYSKDALGNSFSGLPPAYTFTTLNTVVPATIPADPSGVLTSGYTAGTASVFLWWTDNSLNETYFEIYRRPGGQPNGPVGAWITLNQLGSNITSYTDVITTPSPYGSYEYRVGACNTAGCASNSGTVAVLVPSSTATTTGMVNNQNAFAALLGTLSSLAQVLATLQRIVK